MVSYIWNEFWNDVEQENYRKSNRKSKTKSKRKNNATGGNIEKTNQKYTETLQDLMGYHRIW